MKNIAILGLRLIAIWAFLQALLQLQYFPSFFDSEWNEYSVIVLSGTIISFLVYLLSAIILAFKAPSISKFLCSESESDSITVDNYEKLASILFATAGILIFFWSVNTFIGSINNVNFNRAFRPDYMNLTSEFIMVLLGGGIQLIFGLCLFFGGKKIAHWWYQFRNWT